MGTDISGYIECRERPLRPDASRPWRAAIDLDLLYGDRHYDAFGCLFGVRNYASFRPLAAGRGLPEDLSDAVRQAAESWEHHDATWISWAEVARVDWDEPAESADQRLRQYLRRADGTLEPMGKSLWGPSLMEATGASYEDVLEGRVRWSEGQEFELGDLVFRAVTLRRRDVVPPDGSWRHVWRVMETLAERTAPDDVRLVVWFDS
ncbi:hypothetical protein [Actinomadura nitritigenes]|uniref:hypothetical protein n=1 Tax=Actinomadura nitritigenes TaxID=134602 RepID=UPI003D947FC4